MIFHRSEFYVYVFFWNCMWRGNWRLQVEQRLACDDRCWHCVLGIWSFIIIISILLFIFEKFHNKNNEKESLSMWEEKQVREHGARKTVRTIDVSTVSNKNKSQQQSIEFGTWMSFDGISKYVWLEKWVWKQDWNAQRSERVILRHIKRVSRKGEYGQVC